MNTPVPPTPQDFDAWARLAATNRPAFEDRRHQVIETAIRRAPVRKQQRLRCLQWKLDRIRDTARTPMVACLRMHRMLWDAVAGESGLLACLQYATGEQDHPRRRHASRAKVVPFRQHP